MGWRRRAYFEEYPGSGPFSHLPPWERPGWAYAGRGHHRWLRANPLTCARFPWLPRWWWADPTYKYEPQTPKPQDEIVALEACVKELSEDKISIEKEINDVEEQLKQLKSKLDSEKTHAVEQ